MSVVVVGVSAFYHNSSVCVLKDGELLCAVDEERFTRIKHDPQLPCRAFRWCLESTGLHITDVDCIAYYEDPRKKIERQIWMNLQPGASERARTRMPMLLDAQRVEREIRHGLGFDGRIELVDHHLSHGASSFYFSGFSDSAILTVDGVGEWATTTFGRADGDDLEIIEEVHFPHSLGLLYSTITSYLGFEVNDAEYKVMGLAPYGKPLHVDKIRKLIHMGEQGQYTLDLRYFDFLSKDRMASDLLSELMGQPPREPESEIDQFHQDVAHSLQVVLEDVLLEKARYLHGRVPSKNLCMAGGVALNCVANGRVRRDGPFANVFVQPASNDAGGALGAAAVAHRRLTGKRPQQKQMEHVLLGPQFSSQEIHQTLTATSTQFVDYRGKTDELLKAVAERLAEGKVIAWFHGAMEFGPRSLGARSILADPRRPDMRDRINALVKKREAFRPFAPSVLLERASEHFDLDRPSPFMLETCQVRSKLDLPSITHVDGSARVQTVDARVSPRYAALLRAFEALTGCPILLNTSYNMRGEPIVCTPKDAIVCFVRSDMDTLVLEDMLVDKAGIGASWRAVAMLPGLMPRAAISHTVYTLL